MQDVSAQEWLTIARGAMTRRYRGEKYVMFKGARAVASLLLGFAMLCLVWRFALVMASSDAVGGEAMVNQGVLTASALLGAGLIGLGAVMFAQVLFCESLGALMRNVVMTQRLDLTQMLRDGPSDQVYEHLVQVSLREAGIQRDKLVMAHGAGWIDEGEDVACSGKSKQD